MHINPHVEVGEGNRTYRLQLFFTTSPLEVSLGFWRLDINGKTQKHRQWSFSWPLRKFSFVGSK